jgi:hypothetical protein
VIAVHESINFIGRHQLNRPWATFKGEDPRRVLQETVDALNLGERANPRLNPKAHARLLRLVRAWKDSGPDLFKMTSQGTNEQVSYLWKAWECRLAPTHSGRAYLFLSPTGEHFRDVVAFYFIRLILCPDWAKLGSPCLNCGKWYVKKTKRTSEFCTARCAGNATKARERARRRKQKLASAKELLRNYSGRHARYREMDWKQWVVEGTDGKTSRKFLTMVVDTGELVPPKTSEAQIAKRKAKRP